MAMRGMVHRHNLQDPFGPIYKRVVNIRKLRQRWETDMEYAHSQANKEGCALIARKCVGLKWTPTTGSALELPQGHKWTPSEDEIIDLVAVELFGVRNPHTGFGQITGDSDADEYALRKCILYDLVEFRGDMAHLATAWEQGEREPPTADTAEPGSATVSGAPGGGGEAPAKLPYKRPTLRNGSAVDTMSPGGIDVKKAAITFWLTVMTAIQNTAAFDDKAMVVYGLKQDITRLSTDLFGMDFGDFVDWIPLLALLYLIFIHVWILWDVISWTSTKVRALRARALSFLGRGVQSAPLPAPAAAPSATGSPGSTGHRRSVAVQVELAPAVGGMTVDGLKLECEYYGLRTNGLRAELERRVENERARRA